MKNVCRAALSEYSSILLAMMMMSLPKAQSLVVDKNDNGEYTAHTSSRLSHNLTIHYTYVLTTEIEWKRQTWYEQHHQAKYTNKSKMCTECLYDGETTAGRLENIVKLWF